MSIRVSVKLALSFLGIGSGKTVSNARRSLYGAIVGIGVSIIPLVMVLVVSDGMIEGITRRLIELSSSHLRISDYYGTSSLADNPQELTQFAKSLEINDSSGTIRGAYAEREGMALVVGKTGRTGGAIRAVDPSFFLDNNPAMKLLSTVDGVRSLENKNDAILGAKIAKDLNLSIGDSFRILTLKTAPTGMRMPKFTRFILKGIVSSGYQELDGLWVFIPFMSGAEILATESSNTLINIQIDDPFKDLERARIFLMQNLPDGFRVFTWKELNRSQFHAFTTTRTLLLFIMFLILFVAAINVSSALVMLVMERRREIAIIKSVGGSPTCVTFAFLLSGFFTGFCGILFGLPLGIACALHVNEILNLLERGINGCNMFFHSLVGQPVPTGIHLLDPAYYLERIPVTVRLPELFMVAAGTLILSVLVSVLPSIRAGREKPLETLRKF